MAALSIDREPSLLRAREAMDLKALLRSASSSVKSKLFRRSLRSLSTKSTHTPVATSSTTTASAAHTHDIDDHRAHSPLPQPSTCVNDETIIKPSVPVSLSSREADFRDSGVGFLPDYFSISRNTTRHSLAIREKYLYPEGLQPCFDAVPSRPSDRIGTETPHVIAVRSLGQSKCSASTSLRLPPATVLQLFLNSALVSITAALHLHRGCGEDSSYSTKGVLYYSEVRAALRILSKYLSAYSEPRNCSTTLDVYKVFAEDSVSRHSELPGLLDPDDLLLTGDANCSAPLECSGAFDLPVATTLVQEHGTNQGKRPASTERSTSNNYKKRSRTGRSTAGEGSGQQPRENGGKRGPNNRDGGDENNDGNDRGTEPAPTEHFGNEGRLTFACPFYKHDPIAHRACLFRHISTKTNYVKQHLRRHHLPPKHCPICGDKFETESDKNAHIRRNTCEQREFQHDGLTELQKERIDQIPRGEQPEERWYRMWDIIFPGEQRPASPYIRDPWIEVVETHTALWLERGGPDRVLGREGVVIPRPGHAAQGQNSGNSNSGAWQAFRADMIASAETFIYGGVEPTYPTASQQLEQQSVTESFSSYDIVAQHNITASSQDQVGSPSIPIPTRDHSSTSRPHPATVDSGISMPGSAGSSAGNRRRLHGTSGGMTQAGRHSLARPQQPVTPRISTPLESQAPAMWSDGFQGDLETEESLRMPMTEAYSPVQSLDPTLLSQASARGTSMDRALSHRSLPEQPPYMTRAGVAFGAAQGIAARAPRGFQAPPGFYGDVQSQVMMQGGRRAIQRTGRGQMDFGIGLGSSQTMNDFQGDLAFSSVSSGVRGTQISTPGLGQTQGGCGSGFKTDGMLATSPGAQTGWGSNHQLGEQDQSTGETIFGAEVVPVNTEGVPVTWEPIESQGQGQVGGDGSGGGQGQASDEYVFDFTY